MRYPPYWFSVMIHSPIGKFLAFGYLKYNFFLGGTSINLWSFLLRKFYNYTSEIKNVITHAGRTTWRWKPHVLLSIAFRGGKQTSNSSTVICQTQPIILQVGKTAAFWPQKCQCSFLHKLQSESFVLYLSWPRSVFFSFFY